VAELEAWKWLGFETEEEWEEWKEREVEKEMKTRMVAYDLSARMLPRGALGELLYLIELRARMIIDHVNFGHCDKAKDEAEGILRALRQIVSMTV